MTTATTLAVEVANGNPAERLLVIAPSYRRFRDWCHDHDISDRAPNVRYVRDERGLRGYRDAWYVNLGVPDREGLPLLRRLECMKAMGGFRNAEVTPGG